MLKIKRIEFSNRDLKRKIKLPDKITPKLAELIGVIIGDGNIYMKKSRYELHIYGDIKEDEDYHKRVILKLFKELFNLNTESKEKYFKTNSCRRIDIKSKAIISFFNKIIGLKPGKKHNIQIPKIIFDSNKEVIYSFIRGLADTDFYLKFKTRYGKKNYYPILIGNFGDKSFSYRLKELFERIDFHSHIEHRTKYDKMRKKEYFSYAINIVGKKNLERWMQTIGFSNKKHLVRYNVWKAKGYLPPYTTISKGEKILKSTGWDSNPCMIAI